MRKRRLAAALLLAIGLAPGTLLRTDIPRGNEVDLSISVVDDLPDTVSSDGFTRSGIWQLSSGRLDFGGYSALLVLGGDTLRAFSDRGRILTFPAPNGSSTARTHFANMWNRGALSATVADIEAATRGPASGVYWVAFESTHSLIRYSLASEFEAARIPPEWQGWSENAGVEAMAWLPDGRFIVMPERATTGFLYPSDPVEEVEPLTFRFAIPGDYNPTDMAALPDGRVLILLRKLDWGLPPFTSAIAIADPRALEEGEELPIQILVQLDSILPRENYEALAVSGVADDGTVGLWLMSDDNFASFQRTLLVHVDWREGGAHEKAREEP